MYPGDKVLVIGTDEQLDLFRKNIEPENAADSIPLATNDVVLKKLEVFEGSQLAGQTIRESGIREKTNGLVVGIERNNRRLLNPESTLTMEVGDMIWIVGDAALIGKVKGV